MQVTKTKGFEKRAQYYAAKAYVQQAGQGVDYHTLNEIIFIAIADCILFPHKVDYKSDHILLDRKTHTQDLKDFSFIFIELPKFNLFHPSELKTLTEKWCYFFRHAAETQASDLAQLVNGAPILEKAYTALDRFYWSEQELINYEQELKRIRDAAAILAQKLDDAKEQGLQQGLKKGLKRGLKQGLQQGRDEGKKEGHKEGEQQKALAIAANCVHWD
jgi:predicted transposase/invertase (TIGR01784 family)